MENIKLSVYVVLKHILDLGLRSPIDEENDGDEDEDDDDNDEDDGDDGHELIGGAANSKEANEDNNKHTKFTQKTNTSTSSRLKRRKTSKKLSKLDLLDLEGPKLIIGARTWLIFYQIMGQLNWLGKPLYLSLLYKAIVFGVVAANVIDRFIVKMYHLNIVNENYRNPIFLFISFLTILTLIVQSLLSLRANLLDLCPFFKILSTPKLCFVREEVQHIVGTKWLNFMLLFFVYHACVMSMFVSKDLDSFISEFRLFNFLLDLFSITVLLLTISGMSLLDLYVRTCFGHWLLALKNHIESRFTYLHRHQRRMMKLRNQLLLQPFPPTPQTTQSSQPPAAAAADNNNAPATSASMDALSMSETITTLNATAAYNSTNKPLLTFDEIQKHLNKMDDHLEATRSVQIGSLVLLSLNAFLLNGALFLLSYHLLADQHNFYHGFLVLLLAINCIFMMFLCYSGDRWVFYALSSFTQTVEDEYFMQSDIRPITSTNNNLSQQQQQQQQQHQSANHHHSSPADQLDGARLARQSLSIEQLDMDNQSNYQSNHHMLLIKKKDVLFCHEFLHQFENHLATPWSNLTVKTHLHMLRTFVTLIAAQIIFDHEH